MRSKFSAVAVLLLTLALLIGAVPCYAENPTKKAVDEAKGLIDGILAYQGVSTPNGIQMWIDGYLTENASISLSQAEWYILSLSQYDEYDFSAYGAALLSYLKSNTVYSASSRLKYALCLSSMGIEDSYIASILDDSIGKQGLMSWVFGLHILNNGYESGQYTAAEVIAKLLELQFSDGGWNVMGQQSDVDITAMTVQALAPYYSTEDDVKQAVDMSLNLLSKKQLDGGDFASYGVANPESTGQVMIALSALGIDVSKDTRFIKNGNTLFDGIMKYRLSDGSFCHKDGGASNAMATEQVFRAAVAYLRMTNGKPSLYLLDSRRANDEGTDTEIDMGTDFEPDTDAEPDTDIETENGTANETDTEPYFESTSVADTNNEPTTDTEIGTETDSEPGTDIETENGAANETDTEPYFESTSVADTDSEPMTDTEIGTGTGSEPGTDIETENDTANETDTEPHFESTSVADTDSEPTTDERLPFESEELPTEPPQGTSPEQTEKTPSDTNGDISNADLGYKPWACLIAVCVGGVLCAVLFALKKRHIKNFIAVFAAVSVAIVFIRSTELRSTDEYYNGESEVKESVAGTVTLTIRCDTVAGRADHIPENGIILDVTEFNIAEGDTVYTVLTEAARRYKIQLENNGDDTFVYISGIAYIYEFEYGDLSGWMYYVNGECPSVGAGEYVLKDGDRIEWMYTCSLGEDLK